MFLVNEGSCPTEILHQKQATVQFVHVKWNAFTFAFQPSEAEMDRLESVAVYCGDNLYHTNLFFHRAEENWCVMGFSILEAIESAQ